MGRSPCCEKVGLKKGPWTPEEDQKLLDYIEQHGHGSWRALPEKAGLQRCGKSCRLRWTNYLRPDIKRGKFTSQEDQTIIQLHALLGNRWSAIATHLPKRTDNEIKNYWNTHLKKRLIRMGIDPLTHKPKNNALLSNDKNAANLSHMAQWESARLEAEARLASQSKLGSAQSNSMQIMKAEASSPGSEKIEGCGFDGGSTAIEGEAPAFTAAYPLESGTVSSLEGDFGEKFTELLLSGSSGERSVAADGSDSDNGGDGNRDYYEDNKNYWNRILFYVNSSPSDSPIF